MANEITMKKALAVLKKSESTRVADARSKADAKIRAAKQKKSAGVKKAQENKKKLVSAANKKKTAAVKAARIDKAANVKKAKVAADARVAKARREYDVKTADAAAIRANADKALKLANLQKEHAEKGVEMLRVGEFKIITDFKLVWDTIGRKAKIKGAFYKPVVPKGYRVFGHFGQGTHRNPNGKAGVLAIHESTRIGLAHPTHLYPLWGSPAPGKRKKKVRAPLDGTLWWPVPPKGFVPLGFLWHAGKGKPSVKDIVCVDARFAVEVAAPSLIWKDKGTGSKNEISFYFNETVGTFYVQPGHDKPRGKPAYALHPEAFNPLWIPPAKPTIKFQTWCHPVDSLKEVQRLAEAALRRILEQMRWPGRRPAPVKRREVPQEEAMLLNEPTPVSPPGSGMSAADRKELQQDPALRKIAADVQGILKKFK